MGERPPFLYRAPGQGAQFPTSQFDPKAVSRASCERKPVRPKKDGPLISFNRHPDAHVVPSGRLTNLVFMGPRTKKWIWRLRQLQVLLRILELNAAAGLLVLMVLIVNFRGPVVWALRVAPAFALLHAVYGIWHCSKPPAARTPSSSAAYNLFAGLADLIVAPLYAVGCLTVLNQGNEWKTRLADPQAIEYLVPAVYYTFIASGGFHILSLLASLWLALKFRKISQMPPDMNPLEDHLTSRVNHKRNKSSVATTASHEDESRFSTPLESRHRSGLSYEDVTRPPTVPFLETRPRPTRSWDTRLDLPGRQYQITPGNSPRNSAGSVDLKRLSDAASLRTRSSYHEVPLHDEARDIGAFQSVPPSGQARTARFTETWSTTESLISRTQQRNRAMRLQDASLMTARPPSKPYQPLSPRYTFEDSPSSSDTEDEEVNGISPSSADNHLGGTWRHPDPLGSHPAAKIVFCEADGTSSRSRPVLSESSENPKGVPTPPMDREAKSTRQASYQWWSQRSSSIQTEDTFYSKPYGDLKPATPPIMVGGARQVSSGHDLGDVSSVLYSRRNVSGREAEEGRVIR